MANSGKTAGKRQLRQDAIRSIIRTYQLRTQRDLAEKLREAGFDCTQATVSRDIVEMGLLKTDAGFYALPEQQRITRLMSELVVDVQVGGTIVVIKTLPGGAQGVCAALDQAGLEGALGTVAGDDTIMVAALDEAAAQNVAYAIEGYRRR